MIHKNVDFPSKRLKTEFQDRKTRQTPNAIFFTIGMEMSFLKVVLALRHGRKYPFEGAHERKHPFKDVKSRQSVQRYPFSKMDNKQHPRSVASMDPNSLDFSAKT